MKLSEAFQAIGTRLLGLPGLPTLYWENEEKTPGPPPYGVVQFVPVGVQDRTLAAGGSLVASGYVLVAFLVPLGKFTSTGVAYAELVQAGFPAGLRLTQGGTGVLIPSPPALLPGYPDDSAWRVPIQIDFLAR